MEDNIEVNEGTAVNTEVDTSATESAPVEGEGTLPVDEEVSTETESTNEDTQSEDTSNTEEPTVPKWRLDQVIEQRNKLREQLLQGIAPQGNTSDQAPQEYDSDAQEEEAQIRRVLKEMGFVTKEEQEERERETVAQNMFISEMNRLEALYDGKNGFPKFDPKEIADYMDSLHEAGQSITDPETAYRLKYYDQIVDAQVKARRSTPHSESQSTPSGEKNDTRSADLEVAKQTGDIDSFIKKYVPMPE